MSEIFITKRDGRKEALDLEKLHKVVFFACDGLTGVSASQVELKSQISFQDNITSEEIQETMIKSAADLISEETPNYQFCLLYTSPSPRDSCASRMPSSA